MPLQYAVTLKAVKLYFVDEKVDFVFAQNIDCGCTLEPPYWGVSNEYLQSMFNSKNKSNVYPCKFHFFYIKLGCKVFFITWTSWHDGSVLNFLPNSIRSSCL